MRKSRFLRPLLLTTIISAGAAYGVSLTPVLANSAPFELGKVWSVSSAQAKLGDASSDFCLVGNEYQNGFRIRLSTKGQSVQVVALDFRQDIFVPGQDYGATLGLDSGVSSSLQAKAFNASTLLFDLKNHQALSASLLNSQAMNLNVSGNAFRLSLANLNGTTGQLKAGCGQSASQPQQAIRDASSGAPSQLQKKAMVQDPDWNESANAAQDAVEKSDAKEVYVRRRTKPLEATAPSAELLKAVEAKEVLSENSVQNIEPAAGNETTLKAPENEGTSFYADPVELSEKPSGPEKGVKISRQAQNISTQQDTARLLEPFPPLATPNTAEGQRMQAQPSGSVSAQPMVLSEELARKPTLISRLSDVLAGPDQQPKSQYVSQAAVSQAEDVKPKGVFSFFKKDKAEEQGSILAAKPQSEASQIKGQLSDNIPSERVSHQAQKQDIPAFEPPQRVETKISNTLAQAAEINKGANKNSNLGNEINVNSQIYDDTAIRKSKAIQDPVILTQKGVELPQTAKPALNTSSALIAGRISKDIQSQRNEARMSAPIPPRKTVTEVLKIPQIDPSDLSVPPEDMKGTDGQEITLASLEPESGDAFLEQSLKEAQDAIAEAREAHTRSRGGDFANEAPERNKIAYSGTSYEPIIMPKSYEPIVSGALQKFREEAPAKKADRKEKAEEPLLQSGVTMTGLKPDIAVKTLSERALKEDVVVNSIALERSIKPKPEGYAAVRRLNLADAEDVLDASTQAVIPISVVRSDDIFVSSITSETQEKKGGNQQNKNETSRDDNAIDEILAMAASQITPAVGQDTIQPELQAVRQSKANIERKSLSISALTPVPQKAEPYKIVSASQPPAALKAPEARSQQENIPQSWTAKAGEDIKIVLARWSERADMDLVWDADRGGKLKKDIAVTGDVEGAVIQLLQDNGDTLGLAGQFQHVEPGPQNQAALLLAQKMGPASLSSIEPAAGPSLVSSVSQTMLKDAKEQEKATANTEGPVAIGHFETGQSLRQALERLAQIENIDLKWNADRDFTVKSSIGAHATFEESLSAVLSQFDNNAVRPVGQLNIDPTNQQKLLIIETERTL